MIYPLTSHNKIINDAYAFDIELLKVVSKESTTPFFCVCFERENEKHVFEISERRNDLEALKKFVKNIVIAGYNSGRYDNPVLSHILNFEHDTVDELLRTALIVSKNIIKNDIDYSDESSLPCISIDLQSLTFQYKNRKSLKFVGVILKYPKVSDIPLNPETGLGMEQYSRDYIYDAIIDYCFNDTGITYLLYKKSKDKIKLRLDTMIQYPDADLLSLYDSSMSQVLMIKEYSRVSGIKETDLKWLKTPLNYSYIKNVVDKDFLDRLYFSDKTKKKVEQFLNLRVDFTKDDDKSSSNVRVITKAVGHDLAAGGIHSVQSGGKKYLSDDKFIYLDFDYGSYYPYLIRVFNIGPKHLQIEKFVELMGDWIDNRIKYKTLAKQTGKAEYETFAGRLKIFLNSVY